VGEKVVDGYRQQFRLARRQLLDLLNIQAEAFGYQSAATSAYYDEQIARTRLLASMGDLARRFAP
jgi:outer membrane protein TolC